ncbi:flagellar hook-length control protein FliK [Serratia sp. AKBS12]|uniref:flagellar hook-length control protein FliK n=1 Tax=Serratia sp. AKBS12 TaxID=2974597 RepID=UPI002165B735|nr:flagellar hook-length control protein FliK [Serratia sp. AKBS12]MCS3408178.1 flagellar hook-length control protein FliK [Serratia sp. AKBS12]
MNLTLLTGLTPAVDSTMPDRAALPLEATQWPAGFAQLLGVRLLPTANRAGQLTAEPLPAEQQPASPLTRQSLEALLSALTPPDADPTLTGVTPISDDALLVSHHGDSSPLKAVETLDAATLQALLTMLPASPPSQQPPPTPPDDASGTRVPLTTTERALPSLRPAVTPAPSGQANASPHRQPELALSAAASQTDAALVTASEAANGAGHRMPTDSPSSFHSALSPTMMPPVSSPAVANPQPGALVAAPTPPQLNAQLGSPEWQQALSQQVLMFHRNGQQSAELRLHPQELGALQITLKLDDNQAQLHIASAHGQVRAAVEASMPQLRHALAESGINLGQSSVGGESMSQPQQQAFNGSGQPSYQPQHGDSDAPPDGVAAPVGLQAMARAVDGVDIFA